jgi:hypothetical protein
VTTVFIHVIWDGTEPPIRHTVSLAGAAVPDDDELALEPHPAAAAPASKTAAPITAADLVSFTARSPFPAVSRGSSVLRAGAPAAIQPLYDPAQKLTGKFPVR